MKLRFLALGLLATLAAVASAQVLRPPSEKSRDLPRITEQARPPSTAVRPDVPVLPARNALPLDSARAPVPVRFTPRREFVPAGEAPSAAPATDTDAVGPAKMTEAAARAAMEGDGYKSIRAIARGPDGVWKAVALRGQTEVVLSVDPTGNVSAN